MLSPSSSVAGGVSDTEVVDDGLVVEVSDVVDVVGELVNAETVKIEDSSVDDVIDELNDVKVEELVEDDG